MSLVDHASTVANNTWEPDALVATYQAATNWSTLADRIKPISELP